MFVIDDEFLTSVGYNVATMSDADKQRYIGEITEEVNERVSARLIGELSDEQVEEFNDIQENRDRTYRWLAEFHTDYKSTPEYQQLAMAMGDEDEAATLYATSLWLNDAIPGYGELVQEELNAYQAELVQYRQAANDAAGSDTGYGES